MCTVYFKFISQIACILTWFNTSEFSPGEFSGDSWGWRLEFPISILQLCEFLMSPWAKSKSWTSPNRKDSIDPCSMFNLSYPRHSMYDIFIYIWLIFMVGKYTIHWAFRYRFCFPPLYKLVFWFHKRHNSSKTLAIPGRSLTREVLRPRQHPV